MEEWRQRQLDRTKLDLQKVKDESDKLQEHMQQCQSRMQQLIALHLKLEGKIEGLSVTEEVEETDAAISPS